MEALLQDLRLSWRMLAKNPGVTAVAVLCMALGIGANTTVYSIVEAALFRPFPFADPERIAALHRSRTQEPSNDTFSYLDLLDLQRQSITLSSIAAKTRRVEDVVRRIEALPGVEQAAASNLVPLAGGGSHATVAIAGRAVEHAKEPSACYTSVTAHFFRTLGTRLLGGRGFTAAEASAFTPVAVVNATFANRFWPGETALGRRFRLSDTPHPEWLTVIGVVADFKGEEIANRVEASAYLPYPYLALPGTGLVVRGSVRPAALAPLVRQAVHAADPALPVFRLATMDQVRRAGSWQQRQFSQMFGVFGAVALALAAIGIYGVLSYNVSQRLREIGVRLALGARHRHVLALVIGQALAMTAAGIACGIAAALGVNRLLGRLLYEISPTDPASYALIALFLAGVAVLASALPARRALDADPLDALRHE